MLRTKVERQIEPRRMTVMVKRRTPLLYKLYLWLFRWFFLLFLFNNLGQVFVIELFSFLHAGNHLRHGTPLAGFR